MRLAGPIASSLPRDAITVGGETVAAGYRTAFPVQSILTSGTFCSLSQVSTSKVMLPLPSSMMIRGGRSASPLKKR